MTAYRAPENADKGAIRVMGRQTERLHLAQAERLLILHQQAGTP